MTLREARLIREIKKRCSYRYLAEVYYKKNETGRGNQLYGKDLCIKAFKVLYPERKGHPFRYTYGKQAAWFDSDNKSYLGDFYWWE